MKNEKGLTFLSTAILVVIIALIAFVVVYFTRMQVNKEKTENIKENMLAVQAKIVKITGDYLINKKEEVLVGTKLSDMQEEQPIKDFLEKKLFDPKEKEKKYYVLNQENLNELELSKIVLAEGSYYIVEYMSSEVYYTKGYEDKNGEVHYQVKDIEKEVTEGQKEQQDAK